METSGLHKGYEVGPGESSQVQFLQLLQFQPVVSGVSRCMGARGVAGGFPRHPPCFLHSLLVSLCGVPSHMVLSNQDYFLPHFFCNLHSDSSITFRAANYYPVQYGRQQIIR